VFHTETLSCKASTNWTVDERFAQAQVSQCHNGFNTSYGFPYSFTTNKIYLHGARSGVEPESPVRIRTWTWISGNTVRRADNFATSMCSLSRNSGSLNLLEP